MQPALAAHLPLAAAVAVTAALFGLAHWITPTYAVLAGIVGAYLGWLLAVSGNSLVPVVAHALYDVVALALLVRVKPGPDVLRPVTEGPRPPAFSHRDASVPGGTACP